MDTNSGNSSPRQHVRVPEHRGSGTNAGASTPAAGGKKPMLLNRSAEEVRRNGLNMEKMIKKNVMVSSRPGSLKRGLAVVEYFKAKNKQQDSDSSAHNAAVSDDPQLLQGALKRTKTSPPPSSAAPAAAKSVSFSMPTSSNITTASAAATTGGSSSSADAPAERSASSVASPSPRRSIDRGAARTNLLLSAKASAAGVQPLDDRAFAPRGPPSITRLSQQLTSPLRHRNSPVRSRIQAMTEETMRRISETSGATASAVAAAAAAAATGNAGSSSVQNGFTAALEQVDVAAVSTRASTAKSPFQSFQSKFSSQAGHVQRSPARTASLSTLLASPMATNQHPQHARQLPPRSGPAVVDLSHSSAEKTPGTPTRPTASASAGSGAARSPKPVAVAPKPARSLFGVRTAVAAKSMCFSTEGVATSLDVSPDGEVLVVGFTDGSVRLYEMDSNVPSDRHGYLLGHMDEESTQSAANANLRVKITADGRYVFVGCRTGPRIVMSINLHNYRNEKENDDEDFEHLQKHFHSHTRLRGFSDVAKYVSPSGKPSSRNAYYLLSGLGVGNLNMWRFEEPRVASTTSSSSSSSARAAPTWKYLYTFTANGNTAIVAEFLTAGSGALSIAATCADKNLRVWELDASSTATASDTGDDDTGDDDDDDDSDDFRGAVHVVKSHYDIPNTKDISAIYGAYAYGVSATGDAYRLLIRDPRAPVRHTFELEKLDTGNTGASSKSRRSTTLLESVYASDDGRVLLAVSTDGIFYYSNSVGSDAESPTCSHLRIIGRNASLHPQYKTPMKVYTPLPAAVARGGAAVPPPPLAPMMAVVTNPQSDDDGDDGYLNVDPTEDFAARWMVPSRGRDCWVCGVRNISHWQAPSEQQQQKTAAAHHESHARKARLDKRASGTIAGGGSTERRASVDAPSPVVSQTSSPTRARAKAKAKRNSVPIVHVMTASSSVKPGSAIASSPSVAAAHGKPPPSATASQRKTARQRIDIDDSDDCDAAASAGSGGRDTKTGSDRVSGDGDGAASGLADELERYKERYNKIVMEWQRRLKGERQMRRLWKTRECEFTRELDETLERLDAAEQQVAALSEQHRDAEKRFSVERLKAQQQSSVKLRYEQLCEQLSEKLTHVDEQQRVLEHTTRTLLQEVDRNVRSLKSSGSALLERNECVVCRDKTATTAIIPCGHLVFCEDDGDVYRRSASANQVGCPVCQRELISLLRIYS